MSTSPQIGCASTAIIIIFKLSFIITEDIREEIAFIKNSSFPEEIFRDGITSHMMVDKNRIHSKIWNSLNIPNYSNNSDVCYNKFKEKRDYSNGDLIYQNQQNLKTLNGYRNVQNRKLPGEKLINNISQGQIRNTENKLVGFKRFLGKQYDGHDLMDMLSLNGNNMLPFEINYNEDMDPIIVYNGPTESQIYLNSKKKRDLSNEYDLMQHPDFIQSPFNKNKRFIQLKKPFTGDKYFSNHSIKSYSDRYDVYNRRMKANNTNFHKELIKMCRTYEDIIPKKWKQGNNQAVSIVEKPRRLQSASVAITTTASINKTPYSLTMRPTMNSFQSNQSQTFPETPKISSDTFPRIIHEPASNKKCLEKLGTGAAICHPSGGLPKVIKDDLVHDMKDSQYKEILSGSITERVVQKILDKVSANEKMGSELGLCCKNITEMRKFQINMTGMGVRCTAIQGELKCFLNWLVSTDLNRKPRSHYYNAKPERNFLFDHHFGNPWPAEGKKDTIALPPSLYGFSQQPVYGFGKNRYTSKLFHDSLQPDEDVSRRFIYRSKIILFPDDRD